MSSISSDFTTILPGEKTVFSPYNLKGLTKKTKLIKDKIEIWVLSSQRKILVKNIYLTDKYFSVSPKHLTIAAKTLNLALDDLENKWGIMVDKSNLETIKVKGLNSHNQEIYIISLDLTKEQENLLQEHSNGRFYDLFDISVSKELSSPTFDAIRDYVERRA